MIVNKLSETVSPEVETEVIQFFKEAQDVKLPFLVELTPKERKHLAKLGRKQVDFVDKAFLSASGAPELLPGHVSLEEFARDKDLRTSLLKMKEESKKFEKKLDDTILLVEAEMYRSARLFYHSARAAANEGVDAANLIAKELAYHHKKNRSGGGNGGGSDNGAGVEPAEDVVSEG